MSVGKSRPFPISLKKTASADGGDDMKMIDDVIIIGIDRWSRTERFSFVETMRTYL